MIYRPMLILAQGSVSMLQKFVVIFEANLRLSPDCGVSRFDILHTLPPLPYTLFKKRALGEQKFTVLAEFSASTAENSASTADFRPCACREYAMRADIRKWDVRPRVYYIYVCLFGFGSFFFLE